MAPSAKAPNFMRNSNAQSYEMVSPAESADQHEAPTTNINVARHTLQPVRGKEARNTTYADIVTRLWLVEWVSWLFATAAICGIVGVLVKYNGRPLPDWPYGITLGALVSLLATIATICLAEPVAAGIGQTKYTWHTKEHRMVDFSLIDEASRGPLKAALLICRWKGGLVAICGAILTIVMLGVNPFVQQVIHTALVTVSSPSAASLPISQGYATNAAPADIYDPALSLKAAVQRGFLDTNANTSSFFVSPQCPTGNCTWLTYSSLAFCSRCADISPKLTTKNISQDIAQYSLPNNVSMTADLGSTEKDLIAMTVQVSNGMSNSRFDSVAFPESGNITNGTFPLADVFVIVTPYTFENSLQDLQGPYAAECILQFCVQNFSAFSVNGLLTEENVGDPVYITNTLTTAIEGPANSDVQPILINDGTTYFYDWNSRAGLETYFSLIFSSTVTQQDSLTAISEWPEDGMAQAIFHWMNGTTTHMPSQLFDNVAASMTQDLRQTSSLTASGQAHSLQTIVVIRWPWMALPFGVLVLVALYLLIVMVITSRSHLEPWKTNSLPLLMHGLIDDESRALTSGHATLDEMRNAANRLYMTVVRTDEPTLKVERGDSVKNLGLRVTDRARRDSEYL